MNYEKRRLVGCRYCQFSNITDFRTTYGSRKAFKTAFKAINSFENFEGVAFLRTYTPSHFENGLWNQGENCVKQRPFRSNETILECANLDLYMTPIEGFKVAEREGKKKGSRFRLIDVTQAILLRPDGRPSRYGHWPNENVVMYNDCVHWCLPGPVDSWNDFLLIC
ncbi:unnamed protein product [Fraxinus pennsylvanica]|uniref:Trichome birefringence-like C-terminal domain-containing protein n=1 Tax=Fraxinus pennsylvanica TaxID=56036 RepID=A0AAD2DL78_9LAMI|nr:unnamed protein product [Fraxinus pennsylvanica]